jgi:prevent-host-death family protein
MDRIGARELRANAAATVRRAAAGERIVVTVDGQPVAQLGPLEPAGHAVTLDDLVARGLLVPRRRRDAPREHEPVPVYAGVRLDRLLREVRG